MYWLNWFFLPHFTSMSLKLGYLFMYLYALCNMYSVCTCVCVCAFTWGRYLILNSKYCSFESKNFTAWSEMNSVQFWSFVHQYLSIGIWNSIPTLTVYADVMDCLCSQWRLTRDTESPTAAASSPPPLLNLTANHPHPHPYLLRRSTPHLSDANLRLTPKWQSQSVHRCWRRANHCSRI